jgi:hypothetical protein
MKYATARSFADPEKAARRILEIDGVEAIKDGRIHVEKINGPFLFRDGGSPAEYDAGLAHAIERGRLEMHRTGTYVKFTRRTVCLTGCSCRSVQKLLDPGNKWQRH